MVQDQTQDPLAILNAQRDGFDTAMGFRYVRASADEVVVEYEIGPKHRQPYGIVHGGVHCAVMESVCSTGAGLAALARGQYVVGVDNHTSFIHAIREGTVTVRAVPLTRGRRTQVWEGTARDGGGRMIATARVRLLCLEPGSDLAGQTIPDRTRNPPGAGER